MKSQAGRFQTIVAHPRLLEYWLFLPEQPLDGGGNKLPLLLFLHGASERGNDISQVLNSGLPYLLRHGLEVPFGVLAPQCPPETWWSDHLDVLDVLLKDVIDHLPVDASRVLASGSSMGGYGVWHLGVTFPQRFAGLSPVNGGGAYFYGFPERAQALRDVPIWAFHGENDPIVPLREAQVLADVLNAADGNIKLTIFPERGHDIWQDVYQMPEWMDWVMAQRKA
ncbi:MAG: prolyl oligopeptidase family serine peptidase [Bellilinea sp.]